MTNEEILKQVRHLAGQIVAILDIVAEPSPPITQAPGKTITVEDVRAALTKLASTQGPAAAKQVLGQFGVSKLTELPVAQYPAAFEAAEALADD